jgi:hypothetical protein
MLVGLDRVTNSLLVIDPTTAASSVLAPISSTVGAVGGMTVLGGIGYMNTGGTGGSIPGSDELYSFDLFTGSQTLIGSFSPAFTDDGISGLATLPTSAVPEPASLAMLGIGVFAVMALKRNLSR